MTYISGQSSPASETASLTVSPGDRTAESAPLRSAHVWRAVIERATEANARYAPTLLRIALAVVFVWFGALKISGASPVRQLIGSTLPFIDPAVSVPVLGAVEVAIGVILATGRFPRVTLLVLAGHLLGTFLTFITASQLMIAHGTPWQLTADGEFVVKNLVLITAALVLIGVYSPGAATSRRR